MEVHTSGAGTGAGPAGRDAGCARPDGASAPTVRWVRCGVVVLLAGMVAGGAPAVAAPSPWSGAGGHILPPVEERSAAADRLGAAAEAYAGAEWTESLALASAALDAAAAVRSASAGETLAAPGGPDPAGPRHALDAGVARLSGLLGAADGRGVGDLQLGGAVRQAAGEVLRHSMDVESAARTSADEVAVVRTGSLADLEHAADAAAEAATVLAGLRPPAPSAGHPPGTSPVPTATAGHPRATVRARLLPGAPAGVAELVRRWPNGMIPAEALCPVPFAPGHLLQCDAAAALTLLNDAYRADTGTDLAVVSAYRTLGSQVTLRATRGGLAAVPGTSNHGWGLAVDLGGIGGLGEFDAPGYRWLTEHAEAFGWHHPRAMEPGGGGPQEPWHWEFATA